MKNNLAPHSAATATKKPQHSINVPHYAHGHAWSSFYSPLPYLPPLDSMPVPSNIPLPLPSSVSEPKQQVLVPLEYQHRLYKTKSSRAPRPRRRKTLHPNGGPKSMTTNTPHVEVDMQNGGEPSVLIEDDEGKRPRPCESKKRLKVLFTKTLKNSDVGGLGRIVLPKREAERYLPKLEEKVSMELVIKDLLGSTMFWTLRYKFWSNSRSRMYVFEHTGDLVRQNGINSGDSIILYEDECKNFYFSVKKAEPLKTEPAKASPNSLIAPQLLFAEKAKVDEGVQLETTDPYQEGSMSWAVPMIGMELSSWSSVSKLWEEVSRKELDYCYKGLRTLPQCGGDGFGSLEDHSRMTGYKGGERPKEI